MIRYLIIDDEHIAHKIIMEYCEMLPNLKLEKNCYSALEALQYLAEQEVDLIFLDLNMPKLKGFEFVKTLSSPPKIIVTTAYSEFALEGYELNVADYLLKPFGFERFLKAINKVVGTPKTALSSMAVKSAIPRSIFLKNDKKYTQVEIDNIQYIEAAGNYTKVMTLDEEVKVREKISDLIAVLSKEDFLQVHKSFAVAKRHIKNIEGNRIGIGKHIIPIGQKFKANIADLLG